MKVNLAHEELRQSLSGLDREALSKPMAPGKWPIRDMLAHLIFWNQWGLDYVRERVAGGNPAGFPSESDTDRLNREAAEHWSGHSPEQLLEELNRIRQATVDLIEAIGPEGVKEKWQYGDNQETGVGEFIDSFAGHQLYHCRQIREWRAENKF